MIRIREGSEFFVRALDNCKLICGVSWGQSYTDSGGQATVFLTSDFTNTVVRGSRPFAESTYLDVVRFLIRSTERLVL
jgi:hypothetical protein